MYQRDRRTGTPQDCWTLPQRLIPNEAMRAAIERNAAQLGCFLDKVSANNLASDKTTMVINTKMLKALAGQRLDEVGAEAIGEAYMAALDDVPSRAIDEAVRSWCRGECGDHDYRWRPAPAVLRDLAQLKVWRIRGRMRDLEKLLNAAPRAEFSEEHCAEMRAKLAKLLRWPSLSDQRPADLLADRREGAEAGADTP
jgi:hypothetical protein